MSTRGPNDTNSHAPANAVNGGLVADRPSGGPAKTARSRWRASRIEKRAHQGWPRLAQVMADNPPLAAFPRFRDLNIKSLLYYQCQLTILRDKLHEREWLDAAGFGAVGDKERVNWTYEADCLVEHPDSEQMLIVKDMRAVLKEYNEALLLYSQICALPEPEVYNMRSLRRWLADSRYADMHVRGRSGLGNTWGDVTKELDENSAGCIMSFLAVIWALFWTPSSPKKNKNDVKDLVATTPKRNVDGLTRWLAGQWTPWYKEHWRRHQPDVEKSLNAPAHRKEKETDSKDKKEEEEQKDPEEVQMTEPLESWPEARSLKVTNALATLMACLLPVIATCVLAQIDGMRNLLLCLAGFTVIFTLGLMAVTRNTSTRTEIFAATATFSAVMVVFISPSPAYMVNFSTPTTVIPTGNVI